MWYNIWLLILFSFFFYLSTQSTNSLPELSFHSEEATKPLTKVCQVSGLTTATVPRLEPKTTTFAPPHPLHPPRGPSSKSWPRNWCHICNQLDTVKTDCPQRFCANPWTLTPMSPCLSSKKTPVCSPPRVDETPRDSPIKKVRLLKPMKVI